MYSLRSYGPLFTSFSFANDKECLQFAVISNYMAAREFQMEILQNAPTRCRAIHQMLVISRCNAKSHRTMQMCGIHVAGCGRTI